MARLPRSFTQSITTWTLIMLVLAPFLASPARAALPVTTVVDVPRTTDNVLNTIFTSVTRSGMVALFNAFQTFLGQLAYDAADYIATGGSGQSATYYKKGFGDYLRDVATDSASEFIASLSNEEFFRGAGFDLCRPDPRVLLRVQLSLGNFFPGMQGRFQRPRPRCDFKDIIKNYDRLYQSLTNDDVLNNVQLSFNTNSSDLGVTFNLMNQFSRRIATNIEDAARERTEGGGFRSINNALSGNIRTPAQVVNEAAREQLVKFPNASLLTTVNATLASGLEQGFVQLAAYTASIFVNTLTSKLLRRIFETGLDAGLTQLQLTADQVADSRNLDTRNLNVSLRTPNLQRVEDFDVLTELTSCPNETRGTWNCAMDQGLRTALMRNDRGGMTIKGALEAGLLHADWQLIPRSDLRRNQERDCYTRAYCAGNLQKLRVLRILPVGFELAANSPENVRRCGPQGAGCVTLGEVVAGFARCEGPEPSPWCRLIDPNWILTALPQQCALKGYGDQLISATLGQRREECQDVQTCLKRDDQGRCVSGYGYCVAEKNVYRFGADECLPREASCRNYQTRTGQAKSYLRYTVDQGRCAADSVGCLWYATTRDPARGGETWIGTPDLGPRQYFDADMEGCNAAQEGCTKLRQAAAGQSSLNFLLNPSFERIVEGSRGRLRDWRVGPPSFTDVAGVPSTVAAGSAALSGERAVEVVTPDRAFNAVYEQDVTLAPGRIYTFSLYARAKTAGAPAPSVRAQVVQYRDATRALPVDMTGLYRSSGCARPAMAPAIVGPRTGETLGTDWQRYECSFLVASSTAVTTVNLRGENILLDNVQLEESEFATEFVDGLNTQLPERHLKVAPNEFVCQGNDNDHPACNRFAKMCRQIEAGCDGYTEVNGLGAEIPAILSTNDLCPAACVGYADYRKAASSFDMVVDPNPALSDPSDNRPTYFIPNTAASCQRAEVGCEAFTNVGGSEQQAYFSYVRSCRKPGPGSQTFFTWEGSDTAGYQLRTWSLVRDSASPPGPLVVAKREPGTNRLKDPATCNESLWRTALDPDCRQFYDAEGRIFYRYYSQTVLSTPECQDYRITASNRDDCEKTDGEFTPGANECVYHVYVPQSRLCSAAAVGCREYRGASAGAMLPVLIESFRDATDTRGFTGGGRLSNESLLVGDQSLRLDVAARREASVARAFTTQPGESTYNVTFWAKPALASGTLQLSLRDATEAARAPIPVGAVQLANDWQRYTVGPFSGYPGTATSSLVWTATAQPSPYVVFLDEIAIVRVQEVVYARRDSWSTPAACDQNPYGVPQPQAMLGCRAYRNRDNQSVNAVQFSRLCRQAAVGCRAFVDTRNSSDVGAQAFERGDTPAIPGFGTATTTHLADRMVYLIDAPEHRCPADMASCRAFGKPQFAPDRQSLTGFTTVYFKDDITRYSRSLCRPSEIFCEEFTFNNTKEYFREPANHVCEYRDEATGVAGVPAGTYAGWFQAGVNPPRPCYPELLDSGRTFGLAKRGDASYRGWVGLCRSEAGECTELRDPVDRSDPNEPTGKPYYFIRNERLDTSSCDGNVDPANGCILMRDTSDTQNRYHAKASYTKQQNAPGLTPKPPFDCERNPTDPACQAQRGRCVGTIRYCSLDDPGCNVPAVPGTALTPFPVANTFDLNIAQVLWRVFDPAWNYSQDEQFLGCQRDEECIDARPRRAPNGAAYFQRNGRCRVQNDANTIVKVKLDRDCSQWLGCSSSEVVFDPAINRTRNLCTNLALCDKGAQTNGDPYCTSYVDRSTTSSEPILTQGVALTAGVYTSRAVGLGERDYSGYAVPNAFLATDLINARVAVDGTRSDPRVTGKFARDYRLAAAVSMPPARPFLRRGSPPCDADFACFNHDQPPVQTQARILDRRTPLGLAHSDLRLCQHLQTGLIGYFLPDKINVTSTSWCYLAASFDPSNLGANPELRRSPYDFQNLSQIFTSGDPNGDAFAKQAFPAAECRSYPQPDAPYPASYVTRWDVTKSPPKPVDRLTGYTRVNVCEYGEECSCTYKRADYNQAAVSKFYHADSQNIPSGVCVGGPRDGEGCLPGSVLQAGSPPTTPGTLPSPRPPAGGAAGGALNARQRVVDSSNASQSCGDPELGGRCVALSRLETVRGVYGQCLERDITRSVNRGAVSDEACLTWGPGPILFGDKDVYHYTPSAGYSPPPSSGQYYCTSAARKPRTLRLRPVDFEGSSNPASSTWAGQLREFYYDDQYVSDEGKSVASIDGGKTDGSLTARQCEEADDDQDDDNSASDPEGLRLVNTGHTLDNAYTETFFKINAPAFVTRLFNGPAVTPDAIQQGLSDANIGYIRIAPFENKNGIGRIGCGYQADWVDDLPSFDYDEIDQSKRADQDWRRKFFELYNPIMTRATEKLLTGQSGSSSDTPVRGECVRFIGMEPNTSQCYFKTWEVGHRAAGQSELFSRVVNGSRMINSLDEIRTRPEYGRCDADKPYFAIRAVFQTNADDTYQGGSETQFSARERRLPRGPWRFVGFWVGACAAATNDVRYMYMNVDVTSADICKELAEVRSHDSLQDSAFTDRVWKEGSFTVPRLGIPQGARFSPFASALTTRSVGLDDQALFQTGQDIAGFSPLVRPTFTASGADTYYRPDIYPKDKWAYLSNLFARIYRIYRYESEPVTQTGKACLYGPFKGRACAPSTESPPVGEYSPSPMCSLDGECDTSALAREDLAELKVCDSFSGINAGVSCGDDPDICHSGAVAIDRLTGERDQKLAACKLFTDAGDGFAEGVASGARGWRKIKVCVPGDASTRDTICNTDFDCGGRGRCVADARDLYDYMGTAAVERLTTAEAAKKHLTDTARFPNAAFQCAAGLRGPNSTIGKDCSGPSSASRECPLEIVGKCVKNPLQSILFDPSGQPIQRFYRDAGRCAFPKMNARGERERADDSRVTRAGTTIVPGMEVVLKDEEGGFPHVYEVVESDTYEDCYADYDCSFNWYNYYLKRGNGFQNIYSPRSWRWVAPRYLTGADNVCTDNSPQMSTTCLYSTAFDVKGCGGTPGITEAGVGSRAGHVGTRVIIGPNPISGQCALQAWRYGYQSESDPNPAYASAVNHCSSRSTGSFSDRPVGPSELNRFPAYIKTSTYQRLEVAGFNFNALTDARQGLRSIREWAEENWAGGGALGVFGTLLGGSAAFLAIPLVETIDLLVSGAEFVATSINSCNVANEWVQVNFGSCISPAAGSGRAADYGRCKGGLFDGKVCRRGARPGSRYGCKLDPNARLNTDGSPISITKYTPLNSEGRQTSRAIEVRTVAEYERAINACGDVARVQDRVQNLFIPVAECALRGSRLPSATLNLDQDNNICTHGTGYRPRVDICPDPTNEFCGLISYQRGNSSSLNPRVSPYPLPTDVTLGQYTPDYLLNGRQGGDGSPAFQASNFKYVSTYKPRPPVVTSLDSAECRGPGSCTVTAVNSFNFNGQNEGPITLAGGQHKSTIRFYAWAAHNQMPIRQLTLDWGDGFKQSLPDAKIKNHKPSCDTKKECYIPAGPNIGPTGLTCVNDSDCPAGYGRCEEIGACNRRPDKTCIKDQDCYGAGQLVDTCTKRMFFGNSVEACHPGFFEFSHVYTCDGQRNLPECTSGTEITNGRYRCSGNPDLVCDPRQLTSCDPGDRCIEYLAPTRGGGCWDQATKSCRFTPRVLVQDNWGWCTGECRQHRLSGTENTPIDDPVRVTRPEEQARVLHPYGGCYAGRPNDVDDEPFTRLNNVTWNGVGSIYQDASRLILNECSLVRPNIKAGISYEHMRPWIVYPGSLQLRSRR